MTSERETKLWAVSIAGPDDLIATEDFIAACRVANTFNAWWATNCAADYAKDDNYPRMWATPVPWPHDPIGHSVFLENPSIDYAGFISAAKPAA